MLTLIVDFNAAKDGVVRGLLEDVTDGRELANDALALLRDGEGNEAVGTIRHVVDGLVYADVNWQTWTTEGSIRVELDQTPVRGAVVESISAPGVHERASRGGLSARLEGAEQQFALA